MILRRKIYNFNQHSLRYENKVVPFGIVFKKFLRFFSISTLLAILFSAVFYLFFGSPIEGALELQVNGIKADFISLNSEIEDLQSKLHNRHFIDDKYYRELLELDSLPQPMRLAGTGGAEEPVNLLNYTYYQIIKSTSKRLKSIENQVKIQSESYSTITKEALILNSELKTIPAIKPVKPDKKVYITSRFGYRTDPFTKLKRRHLGLDFHGPKNTEIYATADGIIGKTKVSSRGYGKEIIISHKFDYSTRYAHLNEILVEEGQEVKRGQLIGLMGSTGRSTGTHLHYEVKIKRRQVNPIFYFSDDLTAEEYMMITELSLKDKN